MHTTDPKLYKHIFSLFLLTLTFTFYYIFCIYMLMLAAQIHMHIWYMGILVAPSKNPKVKIDGWAVLSLVLSHKRPTLTPNLTRRPGLLSGILAEDVSGQVMLLRSSGEKPCPAAHPAEAKLPPNHLKKIVQECKTRDKRQETIW
jgi:hypothetical protein